jgi:SAM-dependent methyltransferase
MKAQVPDYWPLMDLHHRVREPLYREIIADAHLPPDALILDAGCGDAFYSRLLADALGPGARIVAVDHEFSLLRACSCSASVRLCLGDMERPGFRHAAFDVVWLCRAMHSALDPLRRISALAALLRPGGRLVVVENDFAHYPGLSLPPDFERRIRIAHHQYLTSRHADGSVLERYHASRHLPAWLGHAGLQGVTMRRYVIKDVGPMAGDVEVYWRLFMAWLGNRVWPYLSPEERQTYSRAFDPESPDYRLDRPGFSCLEPTTVVCGLAPA